jgi:hypothetical protein
LASQAFTALQEALIQYEPRPSGEIDAKPVILASDLDAKNLTFTLSLPSVGNWKPKVESPSAEAGDQRIWKLTGLPDDLHKHWGTVRLDRGKGNLTFKSELGANEPRDHLYVPFIFASDASPTPQLITLPAVAAPDEVEASRADGQSCSLSDVLTGDAVSLKMSQSLKVAPSLLGGPNVLKMTLNSGRPNGTRVLELETRAGNGSLESTTDLWCTIADGDANKGRRVWLESLESKFDAADGGLTVLLSRKDSQPWTARVTRFKARDLTQPWPPLSAEWNRDKFVRLFKVMLDEGHRNPKNTVDALEKKIDTALSLKPTEQKMRLQAWRDQAFDFVKKQEGPFHAFVQAAFVRERGKRPQSPPPPEAPASEADAEAMNKYKIAKSKYDATKVSTDKAIEEWNADLDQWLCSPLWLARFLDESPGQDGDTDPHDFARAVLGIDAWIALHDKVDPVKKECSEILLETLVSATLSLLWKMPQDGGPIPVKRFEIKHGGKEVKVTQPDEQRQ